LGFELKPPHTKLLRDGIYELRIREGRQNYRVLYFFSGKNIAVLSQGFTKESEVPPAEIARAIANKRLVLQDFDKHTADFEQDE
jgi:putative component of toxin-antitoxin plasmid stabilization module